jgi:hypothetical protein
VPRPVATTQRFETDACGVPLEQLEIWDGRLFTAPATDPGIAQVAFALATRLQSRALVGTESVEDYPWALVTTDGTHRRVVVDSAQLDADALVIHGT